MKSYSWAFVASLFDFFYYKVYCKAEPLAPIFYYLSGEFINVKVISPWVRVKGLLTNLQSFGLLGNFTPKLGFKGSLLSCNSPFLSLFSRLGDKLIVKNLLIRLIIKRGLRAFLVRFIYFTI